MLRASIDASHISLVLAAYLQKTPRDPLRNARGAVIWIRRVCQLVYPRADYAIRRAFGPQYTSGTKANLVQVEMSCYSGWSQGSPHR